MRVWIIEGEERWPMETEGYDQDYRTKLEAELLACGHAWRHGALILECETLRKMAAAPDLLRACELALAHVPRSDHAPDGGIHGLMERAIAKAKGE